MHAERRDLDVVELRSAVPRASRGFSATGKRISPPLSIEMRQVGDSVEVRITNAGNKLDPKTLENVFDRFVRGENAQSKAEGCGLGLTIAQWIVQSHGESILETFAAKQCLTGVFVELNFCVDESTVSDICATINDSTTSVSALRQLKAKQLLFVIGLPRSGTSLLYAILNQHPQVALMYEADILALPGISLATRLRRNWLTRIEFWNGALSRHGFDITPDFFRDVTSARSLYLAYATRKFRRKIIDARSLPLAFAAGKQATVYGEKSPHYYAPIKHLSKSFPDARFIVIRRDFAEIYRSVLDAAKHSSHFARVGTWPRLILQQEKLIRETSWLRAHAIPLYSVHYRDLVNQTERIAREICAFLDLPFCERMTTLKNADLSAVYAAQIHSQLRGREIRARAAMLQLNPKCADRIARWQNRWQRIETGAPQGQPEPSLPEKCYCFSAGGLAFIWSAFVRIVFEFLPLSCLRFYRTLKNSLAGRRVNVPESLHLSMLAWIQNNKQHVFAGGFSSLPSLLLLGVFGIVDYYTGPLLTLAPFYLIPPAYATWRRGLRAGILVSFVSAITWTVAQMHHLTLHVSAVLFAWNGVMRFTLLTAFVAIFSHWIFRPSEVMREESRAGSLLAKLLSLGRTHNCNYRTVFRVIYALIILVLVVALGVVGRRAGPFLTLAPFYLVPPAIAARDFGLIVGILVSFISASVWTATQTGNFMSHMDVPLFAWNVLMRFTVLALFTVIFLQWIIRSNAAPPEDPELEASQVK